MSAALNRRVVTDALHHRALLGAPHKDPNGMKPRLRILFCIAIGALIGTGVAIRTVRAGALSTNRAIGPWQTGSDFATARAGAQTRAIIALRGLLALPAREARYYAAQVDDTGNRLDGHCRYRVTGGQLPARWWSLTLYDNTNGFLVANAAGRYSYNSAGLPKSEQDGWQIVVAPRPVGWAAPGAQGRHWLPTGGIDRFDLTLRVYLPAGGGTTNLTRTQLPSITKEDCA